MIRLLFCTIWATLWLSQAPGQALNWYAGTMHAHSDYSDGDVDNVCNGANSPTCCYGVGNGALNFDYMGIADHNHNEGTAMTPAKYLSGVTESAAYTTANPGFVGLYGMEWGTISTGGHLWVYGIDSLIGWNAANYHIFCAKGDYTTLINLINARPGAFASICHPNATDVNNIFGTAYNAAYDQALVGITVRNGPASSTNTTYSDPPGANYSSFYNTLLSKGYHVGPVVDLDNHNSATMGKSNEGRTFVLATSLTKNEVYDAYRLMRFYASDDYNVRVTFTESTTNWMGSILTANYNPQLLVNVNDLGGEVTSSIQIWHGVPGSGAAPTLLTSNTNSASLSFTHTLSTGNSFYYYAEITQADGDKMWTAPIWFTKNTPLAAAGFGNLTAAVAGSCVMLNWTCIEAQPGDLFIAERAVSGSAFKEVGRMRLTQAPAGAALTLSDPFPASGESFYRIRAVGHTGAFESEAVKVWFEQPVNSVAPLQLWPNPARDQLHFAIQAPQAGTFAAVVIDRNGREVAAQQVQLIDADGSFSIHLPALPAGIYFLHVRGPEFNSSLSFRIE